MSLKYFAQKIGDAHYVLPKTGKMRVDAHAFFSDALFARVGPSRSHKTGHRDQTKRASRSPITAIAIA